MIYFFGLVLVKKLIFFNDVINYGLHTLMPERSVRTHGTDKPWMQLIRQRQKAFTWGDVPHYRLLRNKVNREKKRCRKTYYNKKIWDLQNVKPRNWWHEVKHLCGIFTRKRQDLRIILKTNT